MPLTPAAPAGQYGIVKDTEPTLLPDNAWSDGRNVRFDNGSVEKIKGHTSILDTNTEPTAVLYWDRPVAPRYVYTDERNIYQLLATNVAANLDPLDAMDMPVQFSAGGNWHLTEFNGGYTIVANNTIDRPHYITYGTDGSVDETSFQPLPDWPSTLSAGVVRSFGNLLIAGNLTDRSGATVGFQPGTVRLSSQAAAGAIPASWTVGPRTDTTTADEFELSTGGKVLEFASLKNQIVAFTDNSIHLVQPSYTGGATRVDNINYGKGILATGCAVELDGEVFAVDRNDIYVTNGSGSIRSVADGKMRDYFFSNLNQTHYANTFVIRNLNMDEVWVIYPTVNSAAGKCDEALIWNYKEDTWSVRDMPNTIAGAVGPVTDGTSFVAGSEYPIFSGFAAPSASNQQQLTTSGTQSNQTVPGTLASFSWLVSGNGNTAAAAVAEVQTGVVTGTLDGATTGVAEVQHADYTGTRSNVIGASSGSNEMLRISLRDDFDASVTTTLTPTTARYLYIGGPESTTQLSSPTQSVVNHTQRFTITFDAAMLAETDTATAGTEYLVDLVFGLNNVGFTSNITFESMDRTVSSTGLVSLQTHLDNLVLSSSVKVGQGSTFPTNPYYECSVTNPATGAYTFEITRLRAESDLTIRYAAGGLRVDALATMSSSTGLPRVSTTGSVIDGALTIGGFASGTLLNAATFAFDPDTADTVYTIMRSSARSSTSGDVVFNSISIETAGQTEEVTIVIDSGSIATAQDLVDTNAILGFAVGTSVANISANVIANVVFSNGILTFDLDRNVNDAEVTTGIANLNAIPFTSGSLDIAATPFVATLRRRSGFFSPTSTTSGNDLEVTALGLTHTLTGANQLTAGVSYTGDLQVLLSDGSYIGATDIPYTLQDAAPGLTTQTGSYSTRDIEAIVATAAPLFNADPRFTVTSSGSTLTFTPAGSSTVTIATTADALESRWGALEDVGNMRALLQMGTAIAALETNITWDAVVGSVTGQNAELVLDFGDVSAYNVNYEIIIVKAGVALGLDYFITVSSNSDSATVVTEIAAATPTEIFGSGIALSSVLNITATGPTQLTLSAVDNTVSGFNFAAGNNLQQIVVSSAETIELVGSGTGITVNSFDRYIEAAKFVDIDLGTSTNIEASLTVTANSGTMTAPTLTATDGAPGVSNNIHTTYTVNDYANMEVTTFTGSVSSASDSDLTTVLNTINTAINSNTETPVNFNSVIDTTNTRLTLTAVTNAAVDGLFSITADNGGVTTGAGDIAFTVTEATTGVNDVAAESAEFTITPPGGTAVTHTVTSDADGFSAADIAGDIRTNVTVPGWTLGGTGANVLFTDDTPGANTDGEFTVTDNDADISVAVTTTTEGADEIVLSTIRMVESDGTVVFDTTIPTGSDTDASGTAIAGVLSTGANITYDNATNTLSYEALDVGAHTRPTITIVNDSRNASGLSVSDVGGTSSGTSPVSTPSIYTVTYPLGFSPATATYRAVDQTISQVLGGIRTAVNTQMIIPADILASVAGSDFVLTWSGASASDVFTITVDNQGGNGNVAFGTAAIVDPDDADSTHLHRGDITNQFNGSSFSAYVERTTLDLNDLEASKWTASLYPVLSGTGAVDVTVTGTDVAGETPVFSTADRQSFVIAEDYKVDPRDNSRFVSVRFESSNADEWKLSKYSLDADNKDRR